MKDRDVLDMIDRVSEEITSLRAHIGRLAPKAEAYDAIVHLLSLLPQESRGMEEDVLWRLRKAGEEIRGVLDVESVL